MMIKNTNKIKRVVYYCISILVIITALICGTIYLKNHIGDVTALSKFRSNGIEVTLIQKKLREFGYYGGSIDGMYGSQTLIAVKKFQGANNLTPDGVVGPQTIVKLGIYTYRVGSKRTSEIRMIQQKLADVGTYKMQIDGIFSNGTLQAVKQFQHSSNILVDGVVGPVTIQKLYLTVTNVQIRQPSTPRVKSAPKTSNTTSAPSTPSSSVPNVRRNQGEFKNIQNIENIQNAKDEQENQNNQDVQREEQNESQNSQKIKIINLPQTIKTIKSPRMTVITSYLQEQLRQNLKENHM